MIKKQFKLYLLLYVDDIIASNDKNEIHVLKINSGKAFDIKDLGNLNHYLGIDIRFTNQGVYLNHKFWREKKLLAKFGVQDFKEAKTLLTR